MRIKSMTSQLLSSAKTTQRLMLQVIIALIPGLCVMAWIDPLWLVQPLLSGLAALLTEALCLKLRRYNAFFYLQDGSALLTGLLLGICLPPQSPWWLAILGGFIAIALGKQVFGGLGANPFNPTIVGYLALLIGFPQDMSQWSSLTGVSSSATLLDRSNLFGWTTWTEQPLFWQTIGLSTSFAIGGLWLIKIKTIAWHIPVAVIGGFTLTHSYFWLNHGQAPPLYHLGLGGLLFGAFFIATDPVTAPRTRQQQILGALLIGFLTALIRQGQQYPEGFAFAVLLCNIMSPSLNQLNNRLKS